MESQIVIDERLIAKYDRAGPRYTSYPTAPQFHERYTAAHYRELASKRGVEFINVYDVGWRRNLQLFFNIGPDSP